MHDIICITCIYLILFDKVTYFAHKLILDLMREKYCLILMYNLKITLKLVQIVNKVYPGPNYFCSLRSVISNVFLHQKSPRSNNNSNK